MTTTQPTALPELPDPELGYIKTDKSNQPAYSARQMRAALQSQPAAEVSDAGAPFGMLRTTCPYCEQGFAFDRPEADASDELVDQHLDAILRAAGSALRHYTMQKSKDDMRSALRRAILALRPQSESEARRAAQEQLYTERERHTAEVKRLQARIGLLQSVRPQAVPMTEAELIDAQSQYIRSRPMFADTKSFADGIRYAEAHRGITAPAGGEVE